MGKRRTVFFVVLMAITAFGLGSVFYQIWSRAVIPVRGSSPTGCLRCHEDAAPRMGFVVHQPLRDNSCLACHTDHIRKDIEPGIIAGSIRELCLTCHDNQSGQFAVKHAPYTNGDCLSCHDAHQSRYSAMLLGEEKDLCRTCHNQGSGDKQAVVHQPVKQSCLSCHEGGHGSNRESLLIADQKQLCFTCHNGTEKEKQKQLLHEPFAEADCMSCHEAHSSTIAGSALLRQEERSLCLQCHQSVVKNDPTEHEPFAGSCLTCHEAHAADAKRLLIADTPALCYSCHAETEKELGMAQKHQPFDTGDCSSCHNAHSSPVAGSALLKQNDRSLCLSCHQSVDNRDPVKHQPFQDSCLACHQSHAAKNSGLLTEKTPDLCYDCHTGTKAELSMQKRHEPFADGNCLTCHTTHTSKIAGSALLLQKQPQLCYSCHAGTENQLKLPVQHKPFSDGECASCHKPHASSDTKLLTSRNRTAFCLGCHTTTGQQFSQNSRHPVGAGSFNCSSCHSSAHASTNSSLLMTSRNSLCGVCHTATANEFRTSVHKNSSCYACHQPHGSQFMPLLSRSQVDTCTSCHSTFAGTSMGSAATHNHPVGYKGQLTDNVFCYSCHAVHGPAYEYALKKPMTNALCIDCHNNLSD